MTPGRSRAFDAMLNDTILQWIDAYQRGKSGIFPYHVALQVCAEFTITIHDAQAHVARHIHDVLQEVALHDSQRQ